MVPNWTVALSYAAYSAVLAVGAACWLTVLVDHLVYTRVDAGLLDRSWLELTRPLVRWVRPVLWASLAGVAVAFATAALPAEGKLAATHKAYQLRSAAIALCLVGLLWLTRGRMGGFDADIASVVVFAWLLWVVFSGWSAYQGQAAVAGPSGWRLALVIDGLALAALVIVIVALETGDMRMF